MQLGDPKSAIVSAIIWRERGGEERHHADDDAVGEPWLVAEHRDEGQQIDRKRHHPQERSGRDIRRQIRGHRDDEARWNG